MKSKPFNVELLANRARYVCYAVGIGLMIPWFGQLSKAELLAGGLHGIEPATTKLLLYLFVGYPIFLLGCVVFSVWLAGSTRPYAALVISTLPFFYFAYMLYIAHHLIAAVTAAMKGKMVAELLGKIPFGYMMPRPIPFLPGMGILPGLF